MKKKFLYDEDLYAKQNKIMNIAIYGLAAIAFGLATGVIAQCHTEPAAPAVKFKSHLSETEQKFQEVFQRYQSPEPLKMAIAVSKTKRPALMAAIAIKESNGDPTAIGDSGLSKGAFQVQEKHWGPVSSNASEQALQAERILEELERSNRRGRLRHILAKYNGGDRPPRVSFKYARSVINLQRSF